MPKPVVEMTPSEVLAEFEALILGAKETEAAQVHVPVQFTGRYKDLRGRLEELLAPIPRATKEQDLFRRIIEAGKVCREIVKVKYQGKCLVTSVANGASITLR